MNTRETIQYVWNARAGHSIGHPNPTRIHSLHLARALLHILGKVTKLYRICLKNLTRRRIYQIRRRYDNTPILASLHQLPVCFRVDFKVLLITFKALGYIHSYMLTPYQLVVCSIISSSGSLWLQSTLKPPAWGDKACRISDFF